MAKAPINYEDDFTVEDETVLSRLEARDRQGSGISPYAAMAFGANMLPSAGISDVLGFAPDPSKVGDTMPSFSENIESGNYLDAGLQTLGASGDVMLAASPFFPALMVPASVLKGISSVGKAMKGASKSSKVPNDLKLGSGGGSKMEVSDQEEFFEAMGEEGARLEYPRINDLLFKYEDRNNRKALETAFADPDYTQYKQVLDANLLRMFPDGKIPLQRITNYAEVMNKGAKKNIEKRTFDIDEIAFAGNDAERELIVNLNGDLRSFSLAKATDDLNLGSGSLFSPEVKKGRKLLIVSCSADKCPNPGDMEAFDRYTGDMYKSMKKIGVPEENVDLAIMSAKYGLIRRDTKIPNYNVKMNKEIASNLLNDSTQVARIKNTVEGYDEVVVEGSDLYKGVIKQAAGDIPLRDFKVDFKKAVELGEVKPDGGYGSGRQKQSVGNFLRSNTPQDVFHYTQADVPPNIFDLNKASPYDPISNLGIHVGTTSKAAKDRFVALNTSSPVRSFYRQGMSLEEALVKGKNYPQAGPPMNPLLKSMVGKETKSSYGSTMPLKANVSKPFLNPKTNEPFTETELFRFIESPPDGFLDLTFDSNTQTAIELRKKLAKDGFTHIPYVNDFEDKNTLSLIMLIDRPEGSAAVLKSKFGKNDPKERTNPDIMKEDGGVISLKDQAVNMNRGSRGIEPYVQYMEPGGVVNRVLNYLGYGDEEAPLETRNIFEEQREVAEKEKFRPTVEEGIARAKEGRETDERLTRFDEEGPLMRMIAARIRKKGEQPFTPFEKNLGLQDDPYAKKPPVPSTYQTGVEFGDIETGFDLLGQLDFNKVLLAGLRDSRSLSDFVKTPRRSDATTSKALNTSQAYYQGIDNIIQMSPLIFEDNFNSTLAHELMHKGADLLQKASGQDLEKLRKNVMARGRMSKAEHRYIQSIVNKAYVDRMLINNSIFSREMLASNEAKAKERPNDNWYKEQIKEYKKDIQGSYNSTLISEAKRVFDLYMTEENRQKFIKIATPVLEANKISSYFLSKDYDYDKIADIFDIMPFKHSMAIFDTANAIMAEDHITKKFAETMQKAKSSRLTKDYDSYFPEQIPPNFDLYTPKAKAEGGVIGLKDRAVKMHRNVV